MKWFSGVKLGLHPVNQIQVQIAADGLSCYQSEGEDPQFDVRPDAGLSTVAPGWYLLSATLVALEGEIIAPCLYPDYGEGLSEATRIDLPEPSGDGSLKAVVLIKRRLRSLRFDPTIHRAKFQLHSPVLRRISRPRAVFEMLRGIQDVTRRMFWEDAFSALVAFVGPILRGRISEGADALVRRYLDVHRQDARGYTQWVSLFDSYSPARLERAHHRVGRLGRTPLISIVLPVHNTPLPLLRSCVDSVLAQTYPHWQLCIADDASSGAVKSLLREYAAKDQRIHIHFRENHGHICEASNNAIDNVTGEYLGFLDHDDELSPEALFEVSRAIEKDPEARLLYSDEDKIDEAGRRFDPHFKPAWNPDLLRAVNYICHFTVIETALVKQVGGLRPGFEGAQDHDLVLRCVEKLERSQIVHIPRILYHWRAIAGSTALGVDQKPYALEAGRRAVEQHLQRMGKTARVKVTPAGHYRVHYEIGATPPTVTIIIPTRDHAGLLTTCIRSIFEKTEYANFDLVVVDNGSIDADALEYLDELRQHERVTVLDYPAPFNFSAIINHAAACASGEILCLLNNDVEVITPGWLGELVSQAIRPGVGVVGGMLYYPNDTIQHAGVILGIGGVAGHVHGRLQRGSMGYMGRAGVSHNLTAITGACMVLRREVFDQVDGMDESLPVAFNDIDLCIRVSQRGYHNVWTPHAELYHHESASRGLEDTPEKRARFTLEVDLMKRRWGDYLQHDAAYNPNLSLEGSPFDLAFPPRTVANRYADCAYETNA